MVAGGEVWPHLVRRSLCRYRLIARFYGGASPPQARYRMSAQKGKPFSCRGGTGGGAKSRAIMRKSPDVAGFCAIGKGMGRPGSVPRQGRRAKERWATITSRASNSSTVMTAAAPARNATVPSV